MSVFDRPAEEIRRDRDSETRAGWPTGHGMVRQLREALGLFSGAMPITPQQAWEEALAEVRRQQQRIEALTAALRMIADEGDDWSRQCADAVLAQVERPPHARLT